MKLFPRNDTHIQQHTPEYTAEHHCRQIMCEAYKTLHNEHKICQHNYDDLNRKYSQTLESARNAELQLKRQYIQSSLFKQQRDDSYLTELKVKEINEQLTSEYDELYDIHQQLKTQYSELLFATTAQQDTRRDNPETPEDYTRIIDDLNDELHHLSKAYTRLKQKYTLLYAEHRQLVKQHIHCEQPEWNGTCDECDEEEE